MIGHRRRLCICREVESPIRPLGKLSRSEKGKVGYPYVHMASVVRASVVVLVLHMVGGTGGYHKGERVKEWGKRCMVHGKCIEDERVDSLEAKAKWWPRSLELLQLVHDSQRECVHPG